MAKKNVKIVVKKAPGSTYTSCDNDSAMKFERKVPNAGYGNKKVIKAYENHELVPYCFSTCCYTIMFVWLMLNKNYNLLFDRNSIPIITTCYAIEFGKFACQVYLAGLLPQPSRSRTNPVYWLFQYFSCSVVAATVAFVSAILLGAPIQSKQEQTLVFTMISTAVLITPSAFQVGPHILTVVYNSITGSSESLSINEMYEKNSVLFTVIGAWAGASVIPLDWDKDWQRWSIPCSLGMIFGHVLANIYEVIGWYFHVANRNSVVKYKM